MTVIKFPGYRTGGRNPPPDAARLHAMLDDLESEIIDQYGIEDRTYTLATCRGDYANHGSWLFKLPQGESR